MNKLMILVCALLLTACGIGRAPSPSTIAMGTSGKGVSTPITIPAPTENDSSGGGQTGNGGDYRPKCSQKVSVAVEARPDALASLFTLESDVYPHLEIYKITTADQTGDEPLINLETELTRQYDRVNGNDYFVRKIYGYVAPPAKGYEVTIPYFPCSQMPDGSVLCKDTTPVTTVESPRAISLRANNDNILIEYKVPQSSKTITKVINLANNNWVYYTCAPDAPTKPRK